MTGSGGSREAVLGVEDGSFKPLAVEGCHRALLCGVLFASRTIREVRLSTVIVDGTDSTDALLGIIEGLSLNAVILGGITFAGFNVMDAVRLHKEAGVPIVIFSGERPDNDAMFRALRIHFDDWRERWSLVEQLGEVYTARTFEPEPPVYFEAVGCSHDWAEVLLREQAVVSRIPEPVRVAGLIARGLSPSC